MTPPVLTIADAVLATIAGATLSQTVVASRQYMPSYDLDDTDELRVSVVPREVDILPLDRQANQYQAKIDVAVQKKFDHATNGEIDPLVELTSEIIDLFRMKRLATMSAARCVSVEWPVVYSPEHWDQLRTFTSLVTLTFDLSVVMS